MPAASNSIEQHRTEFSSLYRPTVPEHPQKYCSFMARSPFARVPSKDPDGFPVCPFEDPQPDNRDPLPRETLAW